jgi:hypothetical protein
MDGMGGTDNFGFSGFPGPDSDVYGNSVENVYDDAYEIEGGGCNVRVWGNWSNNTFTGIATAAVAVGPLYIWNNVSNVSQRAPQSASISTKDLERERGHYNKAGSRTSPYFGGRCYLFHNTVLQPTQEGYSRGRGMSGGITSGGGPIRNLVSRNNIWQSHYDQHYAIFEWEKVANEGNDYNYDLYNGLIDAQQTNAESSGIKGKPIYTDSIFLTLNPNGYFLQTGSPGKGKGIAIPNFNSGAGVDVGAYHSGKLEFGVNAYRQ